MKNFLLLLVLCFSLVIYGKTQQKIDPRTSSDGSAMIIVANKTDMFDAIVFFLLKKEAVCSLLTLTEPESLISEYTPQCRSPNF